MREPDPRDSSPLAADERTSLVVRRTVRAPVERVFAAWTQPARLQEWWGPEPITCPEAEVDLRVGGHYRIANRYADGTIVWISGEFERIEAPHTLVYTWSLAPGPAMSSRVTVRFNSEGGATEVVVHHEQLPDAGIRDMHDRGWQGCLDGLVGYFDRRP